jgi:hypothetical protein
MWRARPCCCRDLFDETHVDKLLDILRVHGDFKLADFGFAKFNRKGEKQPRTYIEGGTETYGKNDADKAFAMEKELTV